MAGLRGVAAGRSRRIVPGRLRLAVVSTVPPRRCGLASYSQDLVAALRVAAPSWRVDLCAVDREGLRYGPPVRVVIHQDRAADYRRAADEIAAGGCDLVLIEHEYGIFGGPDGAHVLALADRLVELNVPYAVTLHTVLGDPSPGQEMVLRRLCAGAARVTVFTETARRLLAQAGIGTPDRIVVVPHGAPEILRSTVDSAALSPAVAATLAEQAGRRVLATFGLIGPGKGLEVALAALPDVVGRHPDVRYLIAGATHPEEVRRNGERYRQSLVALAERLGVADHVRFIDTFLTDAELSALLARTDLYVTPYLSSEQICSGTLTFAVAAGCPVVSTTYRYAEDLLAPADDGSAPGVLVPCGDPEALAAGISGLLADPEALARARRVAGERGGTLMWPAVAARLATVLAPAARVRQRGAATTRAASLAAHRATGPSAPAPAARLDHLRRLTDATGIIQFARGDEPDPASGYCVDDVARLGIVAAGLRTEPDWIATCLTFLAAAIRPGGMHNLRSVDGHWRDRPHLGDHVGRAVWALGIIAAGPSPHRARVLLDRVAPMADRLAFLRSTAYAVLGLAALPDGQHRRVLRSAAERLMAADAAAPGWCWFEPQLTYDNARLPQALLAAGAALGDAAMVRRGLSTLDWYLGQVGLAGPEPMLRCVGNAWRAPGSRVDDEGDEQPLDAAAVVEALVLAWRQTGEDRYARLASRAHAWFHGANRAGVPLYDPASGGCHDGLKERSVNVNMGAESTLAYHQSLLAVAGAGLLPRHRTAAARTTARTTARTAARAASGGVA